MINRLIDWCIDNRVLVLLVAAIVVAGGLYSVKNTPVDAIPDLSDVQVIIKTTYPGQAPQVVEDQITYPLTTAMLSVPGAKTVRGFSFFGDSYVYVIFDDKTDLYWARSRVQEYLSQATFNLPQGARSQLGPDATGVGWGYIYALKDTSGQLDLSELRSLQDWFLKFELQSVRGVSEVATVGGMVKQYQITVHPEKLSAYRLPLGYIRTAIEEANQELGASVIEMAEAEYMVTASGYIQSVDDLRNVPLGVNHAGAPLTLQDVAHITVGPQMRRGIAELNGEGETVGGIVVIRYGENVQDTLIAVKDKIQQLEKSLPSGVEIIPVYDRSTLIKNAIEHLWLTLVKELLVVALVCLIFLFHARSALVAMVSLPVGILMAFVVMNAQGINANIMSLGGIAIAIGAMIDGAIVMVENLHRNLSRQAKPKNHWQVVKSSANEVGPTLFFSLLIITVSFLPVFALEAQEGKMFSPLAFTKTYAMAAAALLTVTLIPVLMGLFIRKPSLATPFGFYKLEYLYKRLLHWVFNHPKSVLFAALLILVSGYWPLSRLGSEFMPPLDEGDLMYMPTTYPGLSIGEAREILQQTDKLIRTVPEVMNVFGKIGRAETATDPAPLTMIETSIQLKPKSEWREGMTTEALKQEFESLVKFPGLSNAWVMPIKTRIDMLSTGVKTPVGIKISGAALPVIEAIGQELEMLLGNMEGTVSVYSERITAGRFLNIEIDRAKAARFSLNIKDVQQVIATAIGGVNVTNTVEGAERYPINIRYPQEYRNSPERIALLPLVTPNGAVIALGDVANVAIEDGPSSIKSENARTHGWVLVDIDGVDVGTYVKNAKKRVDEQIKLPASYSIEWSGQYEYMERAKDKLMVVIPITVVLIFILLYLCFKRLREVFVILATLPLSVIGGVWFLHLMTFNWSVAVGVGFIALAGVSVELGVMMLLYMNQSLRNRSSLESDPLGQAELLIAGAVLRLRPILMASIATVVGLLPILLSDGAGSEVMKRLAAPMVGGMLTSILVSLLVLPVLYCNVVNSKFRR